MVTDFYETEKHTEKIIATEHDASKNETPKTPDGHKRAHTSLTSRRQGKYKVQNKIKQKQDVSSNKKKTRTLEATYVPLSQRSFMQATNEEY